jgi:hypothetical protein
MGATFRCTCGEDLDATALLASATGFDASLGTLNAPCTRCGQWMSMRPRARQIEAGFVSWAGSPHFEAFETVSAPDLRVEERDDDVLVIELHGRVWEHAFAPREQWLWIRPGDDALGKTLAALRLSETGVEVLALDANDGLPLPLDTREPLSFRHRIRVRGTTGSRRRAAERIRAGI